ncbi:SDR family NAD(P)-dependent oxidoreductase [Streptomyces sp. PTD5-9]|uniref:SDR family NAD(P)-dependent oxidoreductase n=1 Tax=Streptomyces sp. PTD5-9 TaxID=3120150 RepID=UPI0030092A87
MTGRERWNAITSVVVGGSSGLGRAVAQRLADRGDTLVVTSRSRERAAAVAGEIGGGARGLPLDLARPETSADALATVREVDHLVISAIEQSVNSLDHFSITDAVRTVTVKLVAYAETVRALRDRLAPGASVVLFGGLAKLRPYPGSTMVTTANGGVSGLVRTLAVELAPCRVNAIHPGALGDSPKWSGAPDHPHVARTPIGRLVTTAEVVDATECLPRDTGVNAQDLFVDGGLHAT